ncbi:MAG: DUF456 domain-containing protein [Gemmatimonadaceae bacterium]|nr:DUF456 domain-containing protein [Gemmatimonadaceae bacterium]
MDISVAPTLALILLGAALLGSLLLVPLGLPGLWVMLGATLLYWVVVPAGGVGLVTLAAASIIVIIAEVLEYTIAGRYTRQYGGSKRASWGAIIGGLIGAVMGVPVPVVGSLAGAFLGAFVGAFVGEMTVHHSQRSDPTRVATGALVGRAVAAAVKSGLGLLVAVLVMGAALVG